MIISKKEMELLLQHLNVFLETNKHQRTEKWYKELENLKNKIIDNLLNKGVL